MKPVAWLLLIILYAGLQWTGASVAEINTEKEYKKV